MENESIVIKKRNLEKLFFSFWFDIDRHFEKVDRSKIVVSDVLDYASEWIDYNVRVPLQE